MSDYSYVYWLHIFFVGPLFIYVGVTKSNVPNVVYNFLIVLGVIVVLYHTYKLIKYKKIL